MSVNNKSKENNPMKDFSSVYPLNGLVPSFF